MLKLIAGEMYLDEGEIFVINEEGSELVRTNLGRARIAKEKEKMKEQKRKQKSSAGEVKKSAKSKRTDESCAESGENAELVEDTEELRVRPLVSDAVQIGFCPQYDPLFDYMTVAQNLRLYALLRGVRAERIDSFVTGALLELNLDELAHIYVQQLRCHFEINFPII